MEEKIINNETIEETANDVEVETENEIVEEDTSIDTGKTKRMAAVVLGGLAMYGAYRIGKPVIKKGSAAVKSGVSKLKTKFGKKQDSDVIEAEVVETVENN